jgi:hypothetical protein
MQGFKCGIWIFMLSALVACGSGGSSGDTPMAPASTELQEGQTRSAYISTVGEVDTYTLRANDVGRYLLVHVDETMSGSNVDLLVTVYEEVNGRRNRIFGTHKPNGATLSADLDLWIYINTPKDLIIEVRDFMDNDANDEIPYRLTCTFQDSANGNHDFSNAQPIAIGAATPLRDVIGETGEVDCYTFNPTSNGVYVLNVDHQKTGGDSTVELAVTLYDQNGNKLLKVEDPKSTILAYLEADKGPYNVSVEDSDSMDGDASSPYGISVDPVDAAEVRGNDTPDHPSILTADGLGVYTAAGSIDYAVSSVAPGHAGDVDWYSFSVGTVDGNYHPLQLNIDNGTAVEGTATLRVTVYDAAMEAIAYHDFSGGGPAYQNQIRVLTGHYFICVEPAGATNLVRSTTYRLQVSQVAVNDPTEATDGNTADDAGDPGRDLTTAGSQTGFISYVSDVDWYGIDLNTGSANILSVALTGTQSIVDYQVSIWLGEQMLKRVTDLDGGDATHLKTSLMIPADTPGKDLTYTIKVADAQNNEGSGVSYTLTADVTPVAGAPGPVAQTTGTLYYYSEDVQEAGETAEVELEIFSTLQPHFKANTHWLDFRNNPEVTRTVVGTNTEISFPWISGYIDYQGDRDFFQLDFDKLDPAGPETSWYYDVEIQLVVPTGSQIEHVWKLYHDTNGNGIIMDDPTSPDGYKACAGDTTPQAPYVPIDMVTPTGTDTFWIGSQWGAGAKFYIGMSDFDYRKLPGTGDSPETDLDNPDPDGDWGYDAPYYFRLKLVYHPGAAGPH